MILSKQTILNKIKNKQLAFKPNLDGFQLQPHAVDLRLGYKFFLPKTWEITKEGRKAINIDPLVPVKNNNNFETITLQKGQYFELLPEEYVVGTTLESITMSDPELMAVLYPRSSINRRGLAVDLSGIVDVHYKGNLMIPIMNNTQKQVIRIYPGERICQIVFQQLTDAITQNEAQWHGLSKAKYSKKNGDVNRAMDKKE